MNNAAINIHEQFLWGHVFISLRYLSGKGIARSYANSTFNHLKNCHTVFQSSSIILHSYQCMMDPISQRTCLYLFSSNFLIWAIRAVWRGISLWLIAFPLKLMILSIFSCAYCISSLRNAYSDPLPILKLDCIFIIELLRVLNIFWMQVFYFKIFDLQVFSLVLWVVFSVSWWCPLKHKF